MPVSGFVADCCEIEPPDSQGSYYMTKEEAYDAWVIWCKESGRKPGVREVFGRWLIAACPGAIPARVRIGDRRRYVFRRVRLAKWVYQQYLGEVK